MTIHVVLPALVILLALQTPPVAARDVALPAEPAWISFSDTQMRLTTPQEFHALATENIDPKLLKTISAHVERTTKLRLLLIFHKNAELQFSSNSFPFGGIGGDFNAHDDRQTIECTGSGEVQFAWR